MCSVSWFTKGGGVSGSKRLCIIRCRVCFAGQWTRSAQCNFAGHVHVPAQHTPLGVALVFRVQASLPGLEVGITGFEKG
jgi:hypothetical protein